MNLQAIHQQFPLPRGWLLGEAHLESVVVGGATLHLVGLSATSEDAGLVTGSAAAQTAPPLERAYFELVERASILRFMREESAVLEADDPGHALSVPVEAIFGVERPERRSRPSWSNGVAAGPTLEAARRAAEEELAERDRVLRSWYGEVSPEPVATPESAVPPGLASEYEICSFSFPASMPDDDIAVAGVFLFPRGIRAPFAFGTAARRTLSAALHAAGRECLQRLGFLWGEELPSEPPPPAACPEYHLDYYLVPAAQRGIRRWLAGEHRAVRVELTAPADAPDGFVDLTPTELRGRTWIVKALSARRVPLHFGPGHPWFAAELPAALRVHPIS